MSVFASRGRPGSNDKRGLVRVRVETLEKVKEVLEHLSLYIGLAIYTALGAKVDDFYLIKITKLVTGRVVYILFGVGNLVSFVVNYSLTNKRSPDINPGVPNDRADRRAGQDD